jgi:CheY-like chemotaxis protein
MPRMGGMDCTAAIAAEWPQHGTPVIAVTADAFEESRQRCLDAGFAGWLSKPFRVDGMMAVLDRVLQAKLDAQMKTAK